MSDSLQIAVRIVDAVAGRTDSDALDLPPLYDSVDPGALETLVDGMSAGRISFRYAGFTVTVRSDRSIRLAAGGQSSAGASACEA